MISGVPRQRYAAQAERAGFLQVLRAEWTKFWTVRGWVVGAAVMMLMLMLFAVLTGISSTQHNRLAVPIGPSGTPVTDSFSFLHRSLSGPGRITVSVSSLTVRSPHGRPTTVPWAKAGLIIEADARPGSAYAAIMVTSSHGVRMQDDYVHDTAGLPGHVFAAAPRWLRLERVGDAITGYDSPDGTHWMKVATVHLAGLGSTVQGGPFVTSPDSVQGLGTSPSSATATFANLGVRGRWHGSFARSGRTFTVTGTGDIAPAVRESLGSAGVIGDILFGTFPALVVVIVLGTQLITAEYRNKLIRVTLTASPRRARVLLAKAIVVATTSFSAGLAGATIAVPLGERLAHANGVYLFPVTPWTQVRVVVGTAALLATASVLALAMGAILRRSAAAITAVFVALVVPYLLVAQNPFMPVWVADWLTRVTPAAAFAVQQTLVRYPQVTSSYAPYDGYYPLAPWGGLAVLIGYTVLALTVAAMLLRRRDA